MYTELSAVCGLDVSGDGFQGFWSGSIQDFQHKWGAAYSAKRSDFFALVFLSSGQLAIDVDDFELHFDQFGTVILKPNCIYRFKYLSKDLSGIVLCFTTRFYSLRYNNNVLSYFDYLKPQEFPLIECDAEGSSKLFKVLELLNYEYASFNENRQDVLRSYLNIILFELQRLYTPNNSFVAHKINKSRLIAFEELVDQHFLTAKSPEFYAQKLHISTNYLNKICKALAGFRAGDIIRKRVVLEAERLLLHTDLSVKEVAYQLGFENRSYFATFFKHHLKVSPDHFRHQTKRRTA